MISALLLMAISGSFAAGLMLQTGSDDDDDLFGTDGDDGIEGGAGDDFIAGGAGNDVLTGGDGNDQIDGSNGDDLLSGGDGADDLFGGRGNDEIAGGSGDDYVTGGRDDDSLFGEGGDDTIFGQRGIDIIDGGDGDDYIGAGRGNDDIIGGAGNDQIDANIGDDTVSAGDGNDFVFGGQGNDFLQGDAGDDYMTGGAGDDTMSGGQGADTLIGNRGIDFLDGGEGDDVLEGGSGDDHLIGGAGSNTLDGGRGDDLIEGGADASDVFVALEGNDTLINTNPDAAYLNDGPGNFYVIGQDNVTTIENFFGNGYGSTPNNDTLVIDHDPANSPEPEVTVSNTENDDYGYAFEVFLNGNLVAQGNTFDIPFSADNIIFRDIEEGGVEASFLRTGQVSDFPDTPRNPTEDDGNGVTRIGGSGGDSYGGTASNDTLIGNRGTDSLNGFAGDDFIDGGVSSGFSAQNLRGGDGNDIVIGAGLDFIQGQAGDDVLVAQDGGTNDWDAQRMLGGSGSDLFVIEDMTSLTSGEFRVEILDFNGLEDRLVLDLPDDLSREDIDFEVYSDTRIDVRVDGAYVADIRGVNLTDMSVGDILIRNTSDDGYDYAQIVAG